VPVVAQASPSVPGDGIVEVEISGAVVRIGQSTRVMVANLPCAGRPSAALWLPLMRERRCAGPRASPHH